MDPQTIKLIQRLILEVVGIGIIVWGIILIYRGIAGKITFIMQGAGVKVKLVNASPGIFISLIGAGIMWYSMQDFSVEKRTITTEEVTPKVIDQWLSNTSRITGQENYIKIIDLIIGTSDNDKFKVEYLTVHPSTSLGKISEKAYGSPKYWKLVAVANIGKGYFNWESSTGETLIQDSTLLEIWKVSKYYGKTTEEIIKVRGEDKKQAYNVLFEMSKLNPQYHPLEHMFELTKKFKEWELELVQTPANYSGGIETISDLSLKYYNDKTLWPLIVWTNPDELKNIKSGSDKVNSSKSIYIIHIIP